jgi:hypothetical protein
VAAAGSQQRPWAKHEQHPMLAIATRLNELPAPVWIVLAILGFVVWWPLDLALLAYLIWSGKMRCCGFGFGHSDEPSEPARRPWGSESRQQTSGNRAFDEYRAETMRRLEDEQRGFQEFLGRLRMAKDKAEFDQFMAERGARPLSPPLGQV